MIAAETGFSNPPTLAEVQAIIDAANASVAALAEVLEDSDSADGANNGNGSMITAAELAAITGITGVDPANEAEYQALIGAETGFSNPPTLAEVQAIIDAANASVAALAEVLEDSDSAGGANNGNATAITAAQLAAITGITGVDPANQAEYQALIAAETGFSNPPTLAEVQAIIDAANASVAALSEVLEDSDSAGGDNNGNGSAVTAAQLAAITGITGVDPANEAEYQALIAAETGFSNPPTLAEVQAIIDAANASVAAIAEVLEDSDSTGGANDDNGTKITAAELAAITGITGVDPANEVQYQALIATETGFSNPPTVMQVQAIIDAVNASVAAIAEVLEDSDSAAGANNGNGSAVTATQLAAIMGLSGVDFANEAVYQALIAAETGFSNPPTLAQIQAIIDRANASVDSLLEVLEDSDSTGGDKNGNSSPITAQKLSAIVGISGVDPANEAEYQALISAETGFSNPPTLAEVQAIIDRANASVAALEEVLEDSDSLAGRGNANGTAISAEQLASITGISGVDAARESLYQQLIAREQNFSRPPTLAEVQAIIDRANAMSLKDTDGDGVVDELDEDDDNDGFSDTEELAAGSDPLDAESIPKAEDTGDSDGDGIADLLEGNEDLDGDGIINKLDLDSDNDGLSDLVEALDSYMDAVKFDADGDGQVDSDTLADNPFANPRDTDGDGVPDYKDIDADNDGIPDAEEAKRANGRLGSTRAADVRQVDGFKLRLILTTQLDRLDQDDDGVANYRDLDSDNDGLTDVVEAEGLDADDDGIIDNFVDNNRNGLDDGVESLPLPVSDTDNDGLEDYLDLDSDQDGLNDLLESNGLDDDNDGRVDSFVDLDGDGRHDLHVGSRQKEQDTDSDGVPNQRDLDSDGDGVFDIVEIGLADQNRDGMQDLALDSDGDGLPDSVDVDQTRGEDADNDGIDDRYDADINGESDQDGDGISDAFDVDPDGDGWAQGNSNEPDLGRAEKDSDGDGIADVLDPVDNLVHTGLTGSGCTLGVEGNKDPLLLALLVLVLGVLGARGYRRRKVIR